MFFSEFFAVFKKAICMLVTIFHYPQFSLVVFFVLLNCEDAGFHAKSAHGTQIERIFTDCLSPLYFPLSPLICEQATISPDNHDPFKKNFKQCFSLPVRWSV